MKAFTAGKNEEGVRLSRFVLSVSEGLPNSLLYKSFRNKRVKVNGKKAAPDYRLQLGDVVELYINDDFFPLRTKAVSPPLDPSRLQTLWEDENLALLHKPVHLLCHSDRTGDASLVDYFLSSLAARGEYNPADESNFRPALCNRLDRGTEGIVVAAKNYAALRDMNTIIRTDLLQKDYYCITKGAPPQGRHIAYLLHDGAKNKVKVRAQPLPGFKEIITDVEVLRQKGPFSLCKVSLITGRTHQIRAHLAFLGTPILGDKKYGDNKFNARCGLHDQALCAFSVTFGQVPSENTLAYLSGRCFQLEQPSILQLFEALAQGPSAPMTAKERKK